MRVIQIALADDQQLFRQGIASLIAQEQGFNLLMQAGNGETFLEEISKTGILPDIALIDMEMPGMDGMELNRHLQKKFPAIKVIVLSVHANERLIARMIEAGACGYLFKNCDKSELINAVYATYDSGFYINAQVLKAIQASSGQKRNTLVNLSSIPIEISIREREILQLICKELSNAEIAQQLYISVRTAEGHRNNLLTKTGCRNTAGLVLFAIKHHIFEIPF